MLFLLLHMFVFVLGFLLVAVTLISAIRTFVLPRSSPVKLTRFVLLSMRFSFHLRLRWSKTYEERDRIMALFAPFGLLALPIAWLSSVFVGYMGSEEPESRDHFQSERILALHTRLRSR